MSLDEKTADFNARAAARAKRAEERAAMLKDPDRSPENLLKALQDELGAERKMFGGSKKTWEKMLFDQAKRDEKGLSYLPDVAEKQKGAQAEGVVAWLQAQADQAKNVADAANKRLGTAADQDMKTRQKMIDTVLERLGGREINDNMIDKITEAMSSGDTMTVAKVLKSMQHVSWWNRFNTLRYGGMLGASTTHLAQSANNFLHLGTTMAVHPLAVGADIARHQAGKVIPALEGQRTRYMSEFPQMGKGLAAGWDSGKEDALQIMKTGISPSDLSRNWETAARPGFGMGETALGRRLPDAVNNGVDFAAEHSLRLLSAGDALVRGTARGAFSQALAERRGDSRGLPGGRQPRGPRAGDLQNLEDYPDLVDEADGLSRRVTLQERRGETDKLMGGTDANVFQAGMSILTPFVKTPFNIAAQGLGYTPAGFLGGATSLARGAALPRESEVAPLLRPAAAAARSRFQGQAADRFARATLGTGLLAGGKHLADDGWLTGPMPEDPGERKTLPDGWLPWSVRVPIPGTDTTTYIPFLTWPANSACRWRWRRRGPTPIGAPSEARWPASPSTVSRSQGAWRAASGATCSTRPRSRAWPTCTTCSRTPTTRPRTLPRA